MDYKTFYKMQEQLPHLNHLMVMMDTNSFEGFLKLLVEAVDIKLSRLEDIASVVPEENRELMTNKMLDKQRQELKDFKKALEGITKPTTQDLETWREVFKDAKNDPDFKVIVHPEIEKEKE